MLFGLVLETMHGFKLSWYVSVDNETRRFLWVLAHAHGALISIINVMFAMMLMHGVVQDEDCKWISLFLLAALVLMPVGFFSGGLIIYQGDPGLGIVLALLGALNLIAGTGMLFVRLYRGLHGISHQ